MGGSAPAGLVRPPAQSAAARRYDTEPPLTAAGRSDGSRSRPMAARRTASFWAASRRWASRRAAARRACSRRTSACRAASQAASRASIAAAAAVGDGPVAQVDQVDAEQRAGDREADPEARADRQHADQFDHVEQQQRGEDPAAADHGGGVPAVGDGGPGRRAGTRRSLRRARPARRRDGGGRGGTGVTR